MTYENMYFYSNISAPVKSEHFHVWHLSVFKGIAGDKLIYTLFKKIAQNV